MDAPRFLIGQKVKFVTDHDNLAGEVLSFAWDNANGFTYTISSRVYDSETNQMIEGIKICRESELVDMTQTEV